jgi:hypothetical protein
VPRLVSAIGARGRPATMLVVLALVAACKPSSAPGNPAFTGNWSVTVSRIDSGGALDGRVLPDPFAIAVSKNGSVWADVAPSLTWTATATGEQITFPPGDTLNKITATADTLLMLWNSTPDAGGKSCAWALRGVLVSDSIVGALVVGGAHPGCATANGGRWSAVRF